MAFLSPLGCIALSSKGALSFGLLSEFQFPCRNDSSEIYRQKAGIRKSSHVTAARGEAEARVHFGGRGRVRCVWCVLMAEAICRRIYAEGCPGPS